MGMTYSNSRQEEFSALVKKLEAIGWLPVDVARKLGVSKATVGNILKGKQTPRVPTLDSLRRIVDEEIKPGMKPPPSIDELTGQLKFLSQKDPGAYEAARTTIQAFHDRAIERVDDAEGTEPKTRPDGSPLTEDQKTLNKAAAKPMETIFPKGSRGPRVRPILPPADDRQQKESEHGEKKEER